MIQKKYSFTLDIRETTLFTTKMRFKQNDTNVYIAEIKITDAGIPIDLTGISWISFINKTPKTQSVIEGPCEIVDAVNGIVYRSFGTNEILEVGTVSAEIQIMQGNHLLTTPTFTYIVNDSLYSDDSVESTTEYGSLQKALAEVDQAIEDMDIKTSEAIQEMDTKTDEAIADMEEEVDNAIALIPSNILRTWQPSVGVVLGQVMYPTDSQSSLAYECLQSGTTGTTEPNGVLMQAVTDGTAIWGIFDIRLGRPEIEGTAILKNWTTPKKGYKVANGSTISNLSINYLPLYQALQNGNVPILTTANWSSMSSSRNNGVGGVPYFGYDGGDTCILPDERDMYYRSSGTYQVGDYHGDAIRDIKGTFTSAGAVALTNMTGAFTQGGATFYAASNSGQGQLGVDYYFQAEKVVPVANENRVKTIARLPVIFVGYEV